MRRQLERADQKSKSNGSKQNNEEDKRDLVAKSFSDIAHVPTDWLWFPFIPRRELTVLYGDGDVGKTTLTCDIAARITAGKSWPSIGGEPEETPPTANVLMLCQEDDVSGALWERLKVAGADMEKVKLVGYAAPDNPGGVNTSVLLSDAKIRELEELIAAHAPVQAVIISPITAFVGDLKTWDDANVRQFLDNKLSPLARRQNLSILYIMHTNKKEDLSARNRLSGGPAWINVPRSALLMHPDHNDPTRKLVMLVKHNLTSKHYATAVRFVSKHLSKQPGARVATAPYLDWEGEWLDINPDDVLSKETAGANKQEAAKQLLRDLLANGPRESDEIEALAKAASISKSTLRRAKEDLDVRARQEDRVWWLRLPPKGKRMR